ncbi:MAG: alpha-amylase family glycosyl hydrolase, partial [Candidatus Limnocylindrales bacterium]
MSTTPDPAAVRIRRIAEARYGIESAPTGRRGDVGLADGATARAVAARMNAARPAGGPYVVPGDLSALSLLHEISHLLVERYETTVKPAARSRAADRITQLGPDGEAVLRRFTEEFPSRAPTPDDPASVVGELLLTRLANENPAATPLRELFDDRPLAAEVPYRRALEELEAFFEGTGEGDGPKFAGGDMGESLLEVLRAPARHAPTSLAGQLRYVRDHWPALLGNDLGGLLDRLEVTLGVLVEEELGLHRRFGGGPGPEAGVRHDGPEFTGQETEIERFSSDSAWMPRLVLMAKSTYVWLDQLSRRHERDIRSLDAIPDSELDKLRDWGITGLWLIGLWQRSIASETIKRRRGNPDAVASAYSLDDYRIADDLGGEAAYANLRDRAWARGIRLASDMVPNHMGIDSHWVVEHPEWFLSVAEPPYPAYTFDGPDLSPDSRVSIVLEDHYWDATDAAVVFKHHDHASGTSRYIYHGNDGTSFPWNDTAQLDFIKAEVREQVIQTILDVARRFPVIRFDAAMVLARKHVERLWWPLPGAGDGIPSRAEHAMRKAAFERLMPTEFWRDVVDRVAAEVPDTLLLAEAFWLMEGYFVRTLGMHRVYNSAFMHMLRDEDNAGYRKVIRETLEFDPAILERYVNFMSNPDEETALEQFGSGDKYLGVATLLVTLPGLPMLGHGQVEGFTEKYGMEFRRARLDERSDTALVEQHERHLFPLVHRRGVFAGSNQFLLYDLVRDDGTVDENVFAYSNGAGPDRSLIVYHNTFAETAG